MKKGGTRDKILKAAISLFNQYGLPNVGLQQIADECQISVGNLAYHFKYKEDLIQTIADHINAEISPLVKMNNKLPLLIDFNNQLSMYYGLINKFAFFFLDVLELERAYSEIHNRRRKYISMMIDQIYQWICDNIDKGKIKAEIHQHQYVHTSHAIWMIISFWLTQKRVLSSKGANEEEFKIVVWNQILPSLTFLGLMEYEALILPQLSDVELILKV